MEKCIREYELNALRKIEQQLEVGYPCVIRVDSDKTLLEIFQIMETLETEYLIVGEEQTKKKHFHIVTITADPDKYGSQFNKIKRLVKDKIGVQGTKFSTSQVRTTVRKSIMYAIKDDNVEYKGFIQVYINALRSQSTKKFKRQEFQERMDEIENRFYNREYDGYGLMLRLVKLKNEYGQRPNPQVEERYVLGHMLRRDENLQSTYSQSRIQSLERYLDYQ